MITDSPTQLWREYMFGCGARLPWSSLWLLCESNTATIATIRKMSAISCKTACINFTVRSATPRNTLCTRFAVKKNDCSACCLPYAAVHTAKIDKNGSTVGVWSYLVPEGALDAPIESSMASEPRKWCNKTWKRLGAKWSFAPEHLPNVLSNPKLSLKLVTCTV